MCNIPLEKVPQFHHGNVNFYPVFHLAKTYKKQIQVIYKRRKNYEWTTTGILR